MSIFKCKMCGGALEIQPGQTVAECEYCGTQQTLPHLSGVTRKTTHLRSELRGYTGTVEIEQQIGNLIAQLNSLSEEIAVAKESEKKVCGTDSIFQAICDEKLTRYIVAEKQAGFLKQVIDYQLGNGMLAELYFGKYGKESLKWLVLEVRDGKVLVISKYALDLKPYNTTRTDVTWETCSLRKWLNNDFLNVAFSAEENAMIPTVTVSADENTKYEYEANPGNATQDKVFLLSITEANKYFTSNISRQCKVADCAGAKSGGSNCTWWLRSPGGDQHSAADIISEGYIGKIGDEVDHSSIAVRPALWIDLNS